MQHKMASLFVTVLLAAGMCFGQTASKDSAQNPGFPRVVARLNLFNRTKAVGPQTLYTPTSGGLFRPTMVMVCTVGNGLTNSFWSGDVTWASEGGETTAEISSVGTQSPGNGGQFGPLTMRAVKGVPITVSTAANEDTSGSQYNAYIILEQLE
jgi:hypothetical protein